MTTAGIGQSNTSITYIRDGYYYDRGWMYDVQSSRLAQLVERRTFNPVVAGSSPAVGDFYFALFRLYFWPIAINY